MIGAMNKYKSNTFTQQAKGISYRRKKKYIHYNRLKRIIKEYGFAPHIGYFGWNDDTHIKYSKNSKCQKFIKKATSKKVRKSDITNGNQYRKLIDYWWIMY